MKKNFPGSSIIFAIFGFSFVIIVHEFGHFLVAKLWGLDIPTFSIGFGPALFKIPIAGTYFQLSAIPLGGYVSFDPLLFSVQPYFVQVLIILAGIVANIILAYLFIAYCFKIKQFFVYEKNNIHSSFSAFTYTITHIQELSMHTFLKGKEKRVFVGPFGIMSGIAASYKENFCQYILSIALLSLNVAFFNILPLPLLDGGKLVQITVQALFGPQSAFVIFLISMLLFFILLTLLNSLQSINTPKEST